MNILAIIHGRSSKRDKIVQVFSRVSADKGYLLKHVFTEHSGHASILARESKADVIISCGGDGTNHEIVNGLLSREDDHRPSLAFIPAGSGNDFVRSLEYRSITDLLDHVHNGDSVLSDLIEIEVRGNKRFAINMCTSGISGHIAQTANKRKQRFPSGLSYYTAIVQWLLKYKSPDLVVEADGNVKKGDFFLIACANGSYAGNGLGLNPQSHPFSRTMGLTTIGKVSVLDFLKYQSTLKKKNQIDDPRVSYETSNSIRIQVNSGELAIEADGESVGILKPGESISLRIIPQALKVFS